MEDPLDDNWRDRLVATGRAIVSTVPLAGGALGEILTAIIPGQRADRIASYLRQLAARIDALEADEQSKITTSPEKIELIEEGGFQAARATSDERIARIVEAVANGISSDESEVVRRTRILKLFGELDDDEIVLLNAYGRNYGHRDEDAWDKINRPEPTHMQSSREEFDRSELFEAGQEHLARLGLLNRKYVTERDGSPKFNKSKGSFDYRTEVSALGRMLLREIGLPTPFDLEDERREDQ